MPQLEQSAANSIAKAGPGDRGSATVKATFTRPTVPGSLVIVTNVSSGGLHVPHRLSLSGFTLLRSVAVRDLQLTVWYRENCPSISSVSVTADAYRAMQLRVLEYSGVAQVSALDKFTALNGESTRAYTGSSGVTARDDELVLAVVANQHGSTTQSGFIGGLARLFESVSPLYYSGSRTNADWERGRVTIHQAITTSAASFSLQALLSSTRRWIGFLITFKGATVGPARMTSTADTTSLTTGGTGSLTVFGPLQSRNGDPMIVTGGSMARIGPFEYQYRLGGWNGLLIGADTPYRVESHEGLEGWQVRTSDDDLPRGDGALRGSDLQAARQILFRINASGDRAEVENAMDVLYRALIPQRDTDWELIFRHPGRPLRTVYCRPTDLARELNLRQTIVNSQAFALRAADPRHYSASAHDIELPITSASASEPVQVSAINIGNGPAYPTIRVYAPELVTRIELRNVSTNVTFDVRSNLPAGSTLIGDMGARATGAPRSIITIDGQSKYGAWQHPRQTFAINPGTNQLALLTEPAGVAVRCVVTYKDTWSG